MTWDQTWQPVGAAVPYKYGINPRTGVPVVGIPTMWRQVFKDGFKIDVYDNPNTDADDGNPFPG